MSTLTKLTDEEFLNLPDEPGKQELLDGELISLPPAKLYHSVLARALASLLGRASDPSRVFIETGYRMKHGWLIPDVSVSWPDQPVDEWLLRAPMIAIEIASRGNTAEEIDNKVATFIEEGASEVWVIYPKKHSMSVFRKGGWLHVSDAYHCELLDVDVDLRELLG